jgi:hypothetical protein
MGTTLKINDRLSGLIESRYLNTGWLDVGGQKPIGRYVGRTPQFLVPKYTPKFVSFIKN